MKLLKKGLAFGAAAIAVATVGSAAQAATYTVPLVFSNGVYTGDFGSTVAGSFSDTFLFFIPQTGGTSAFTFSSASVSASSVITNLKGYLDSDTPGNQFAFASQTLFPGTVFTGGFLGESTISAGNHGLTFTGNTGSASISGTITIAASAIPEPATWAMAIGGIGFAGGMMRRARRTKTSVSFA